MTICENEIFILILQMRPLKHQGIKQLAWVYTATKRQNQDTKLFPLQFSTGSGGYIEHLRFWIATVCMEQV